MDQEKLGFLQNQLKAEQFEAAMADLAQQLRIWYQSLIAAGLSRELAGEMTRDLYKMQMCKALWPDTPPQI